MVLSQSPPDPNMTSPARPVGTLDRQARLKIWKDQHVPLLYDWISSRSFVWPHGAVQWGSIVPDDSSSRRDRAQQSFTTRALYLAERTGGFRNDPNTLLHFDVRVVQELTAKPSEIARPWQNDVVATERSDQISTRDFWLRKRIIHPGEVNKIKQIAPNLVVTHTDSKLLYVWDFKSQPDRKRNSVQPSEPNCTLTGHTANADYAIDVSKSSEHPDNKDVWIVSGGSDCAVLVWRLADAQVSAPHTSPFVRMEGARGMANAVGHTATVEDVSFNGNDRNVIASVGRDSAMMVWDVRTPARPISWVEQAHKGDINCCDFGGVHEHCIATGGSDSVIRVWDRRFLKNASNEKKPLRTLYGHANEVTNVMWNRSVPDVCASGGEDGEVLIWRVSETDRRPAKQSEIYRSSPELLFRHVGHSMANSKITDLDWLPSDTDPWCVASLSESVGEGGSTLQIWRMSDMIYRSKEEVAADIRTYARMKTQ